MDLHKGTRVQAKKGFPHHFKRIGFTNRLAIYLILFLLFGLIGGFYLAILSIEAQYTGALACWTVVFAPIGTAIGIVLGKIVDKNKAQNQGAQGIGITFAQAESAGFKQEGSDNSPAI